jgi:hypothetical protein
VEVDDLFIGAKLNMYEVAKRLDAAVPNPFISDSDGK